MSLHQKLRINRLIRSVGFIVVFALSIAPFGTNSWLQGLFREKADTSDDNANSISERAAATTTTAAAEDAPPHLHVDVHASVGISSEGSGPLNDRITLVCDLSWEMGNILSFLAYCVALASWAERDYQVRSSLVLRHIAKGRGNWEKSRDDIRACFPRLSNADFSHARTPEFSRELELRLKEQERDGLTLSGINDDDQEMVKIILSDVARRARSSVFTPPNGTITLPFLTARRMIAYGGNDLLDLYFDEIRELFEFDPEACCAKRPFPDETVFHLRNFKAEVSPAQVKRGFKELGPKQTANDLLGHLRPGDRVAVLSRFASDEVGQYLAAMRDRGLSVRFIDDQTSRQDFCFLLSTQKEMVGVSISTYFYWAARLSNASRIITYSLDIPSVWSQQGKAFFQYNYTHPRLVGRWVFRHFRPDESSNATLGRTIVARA